MAEQWDAWDALASASGLTCADWVRALQDAPRTLAAPRPGPFRVRRMLSATERQWRAWDRAAERVGVSWSDWVRRLQDGAARRKLSVSAK